MVNNEVNRVAKSDPRARPSRDTGWRRLTARIDTAAIAAGWIAFRFTYCQFRYVQFEVTLFRQTKLGRIFYCVSKLSCENES